MELLEALEGLNAVEIDGISEQMPLTRPFIFVGREPFILSPRAIYGIVGAWRVLSRTYANECFDLILNSVIEEDWPLSAVPEKACCDSLLKNEVPPFVVKNLLKRHGKQLPDAAAKESPSREEGDTFFALSQESICRFRALELLSIGQVGRVPQRVCWSSPCSQSNSTWVCARSGTTMIFSRHGVGLFLMMWHARRST